MKRGSFILGGLLIAMLGEANGAAAQGWGFSAGFGFGHSNAFRYHSRVFPYVYPRDYPSYYLPAAVFPPPVLRYGVRHRVYRVSRVVHDQVRQRPESSYGSYVPRRYERF
jgi:hypothetical protein